MSYCADKPVIDTHTDTRTHGHTDTQTQATTIPEGQNWPRVKTRNCKSVICSGKWQQWVDCSWILYHLKSLGLYLQIQVMWHKNLVLIFRAKLNWGVQKPQNPIWPMGGHCWKSIGFCPQPQTACIWNLKLQSKLHASYAPETMPPTESTNEKINMDTGWPFWKWHCWKWTSSYPYT